MFNNKVRLLVVSSLTLALQACQSDLGPAGSDPTMNVGAIHGGNNQTALVATTLAPLSIQVTNQGIPVAGVVVTWNVTGSGTLQSQTSTTNIVGIAEASVVAAQVPGTISVTALSSGFNQPIQFSEQINPGPAAAFVKAAVSGDNQSGIKKTKLAKPFAVQVTDRFNNVMPGVTVNWATDGVATDGSFVSGTASLAQSTSVTDATGTAQMYLTLGSIPAYDLVTASLPDYSTLSSLSFSALVKTVKVIVTGNSSTHHGLISQFEMDPSTGLLQTTTHSQLTLSGSASIAPGIQNSVVDPTGTSLYVISQVAAPAGALSGNSGMISQYYIDNSPAQAGSLTWVSDTSISNATPSQMSMDALGKYLYILDSANNKIIQYSVAAQNGASGGGLTLLANSPTLPAAPLSIAAEATGNFVFVTVNDSTINNILDYSISQSGATAGQLSLVDSRPTQNGTAAQVALSSTGYIYVSLSLGSSSAGFLSVYNMKDGLMWGLSGQYNGYEVVSFKNPDAIAISPDGSHLYLVNQADSTISSFSTSGGTPSYTGITGYFSNVAAGSSTSALRVDPSGQYVFALNSSSDPSIYQYTVGSSGGLSANTSASFSLGFATSQATAESFIISY